jgi:hypothetical protein
VPLVANTTYVASYFTPSGHYAANGGFFTSGGADAPPLHALANGVDGPNGVYGYGTSRLFPTSSFNGGNYWVDAIYLPTTTYTITGTLTGTGAAGATVTLTGASTATVKADSAGNFSFNGLANGTYTVTPTASGAAFSPASQSVTIKNAHALGLSFGGTVATFALGGTISGAGGSGATLSLSGAATAATTASSAGQYSFPGLSNGSYSVTASNTGYLMSPSSQAVTINGANGTANFTAAAIYTMSGTISGAGGNAATVKLTGAKTASATASSTGQFSFPGLLNGSYTVTPSKTGYLMSPTSQPVTVNGANATANFAAVAVYTVSGTISGAGGPGATVKLSGAATATVTANSAGRYSFVGLVNGTYTITPSNGLHVFLPSKQTVTVSGANQAANFSSI